MDLANGEEKLSDVLERVLLFMVEKVTLKLGKSSSKFLLTLKAKFKNVTTSTKFQLHILKVS